MKKVFFTLIVASCIVKTFAQDLQKEIIPVVAEGNLIYKVEMANWLSQDLFSKGYKGKQKMLGNISYVEAGNVKSVFYSQSEKPKVLGVISFDENFDETTTKSNFDEREMSTTELDLFKIQTNAQKIIADDKMTTLAGAHLSVIPVISNGEKKVFILSEPDEEGTVIFGRDYLITFDNKYNVLNKQPLHKTFTSLNYDIKGGSANDKSSSHTHVAEKGDMVTSTDIATLLLYARPTHWSHHTFISENYMFFWNYVSGELQAISKGMPKTK